METVANNIAPITKFETGKDKTDEYYRAMSLFGLLTKGEKEEWEKKNGKK